VPLYSTGDRVSQPQYGHGTVTAVNQYHTVIDFDEHGSRTFMTLRVQLDGGFVRCGRITSEVSYRVPFVRLPWIGGFGSGATAVSRHSEIVDPFRDDVPGEATCGGRF